MNTWCVGKIEKSLNNACNTRTFLQRGSFTKGRYIKCTTFTVLPLYVEAKQHNATSASHAYLWTIHQTKFLDPQMLTRGIILADISENMDFIHYSKH